MTESEKGHLERLGYLFYAVSPNKTSFATLQDVPNYVIEVVPYFTGLIALEFVIALLRGKSTLRINDGIGSLAQGMCQELAKVLVRGLEFTAYIYMYNNWRLATLPWDSLWTWFLCFLGTDFAYYCLHRASHEINILWASHQVHHSSEDYNLTTALRQSVMQSYSVWMFNLPMAFFIPPSVFLVHTQFNTLYQFWIHTELINTLGPLEYVLNTPSHHRVHHGRNRYCIDKNYAGVLIIWDRIFGTFEKEERSVVYGLTHPINTFSSFDTQLCHYRHIFRTFQETEGFWNKLKVLTYGPGWSADKPRLGQLEDIPDVHYPEEKYDPKIPFWLNTYVLFHFILVILGHIEVTERSGTMTQMLLFGAIGYQLLSLTSIGALLDGKMYASWLELLRCLLFLALDWYYLPVTRIGLVATPVKIVLRNAIRICFLASTAMWVFFCARATSLRFYREKVD